MSKKTELIKLLRTCSTEFPDPTLAIGKFSKTLRMTKKQRDEFEFLLNDLSETSFTNGMVMIAAAN